MAQLIVRKFEDQVVKKLKQWAVEQGVSMEEELRRILRESLLGQTRQPTSFKDYLRQMPDLGPETLFERHTDLGRELDL